MCRRERRVSAGLADVSKLPVGTEMIAPAYVRGLRKPAGLDSFLLLLLAPCCKEFRTGAIRKKGDCMQWLRKPTCVLCRPGVDS